MSDANQRAQFEAFFEKATHHRPFCFQWEFARELPALVDVPTGLGKTAMVVIGWLWRRFGQAEELKRNTPRRLIYCLPMRVLVEQTRDCAVEWLYNLGLLAGTANFDQHDGEQRLLSYTPPSSFSDHDKIAAYILMGGENEGDWDVYPERDAIIIGTQDMLLSRALNRGYAASRARWPMQFGLLHTDCLWVFDEIQLMGSGLATTAQLEAFRRLLGSRNGNGCRSVWMSATMRRDWLKTVDFKDGLESLHQLELSAEDHKNDGVKRRWNAKKPLVRTEARIGDAFRLADEIRRAHKSGTRTIIVVNTVRRARELFDAVNASSGLIAKTSKKGRALKDSLPQEMAAAVAPFPNVVLLHSRFRPADREAHVEEALANPSTEGTIVISTQVIEAGVDVSATTLFTELAPWASLVQRFGRCNRKGEDDGSQVFWIDLPATEADAKGSAHPYELKTLQDSAEELKKKKLTDVGLQSLPPVNLFLEHSHVIRRRDLIDLFDTTPDLAGNDIDIDRFVREIEGSDVHVFWRDYNGTPNGSDANEAESAPRREELCSAPIGSDMNPGFRAFIKEHKGNVWRWTFLDKKWEPADANKIVPGQIFLVHPDAGGYSALRGWDHANHDRVEPIHLREDAKGETPDATEDERLSCIGVWQTIAEHTEEVCRKTDSILAALAVSDAETAALRAAARWHDWGKAHHVFQNAVDDGQIVARNGKRISRRERPQEYRGCRVVAKAPGRKWANGQFVDAGFWRKYDWLPKEGRKQFRHELVSALAVLLPTVPIGEADRDLVAYLVAAHHGKVRLSIRSLPDEFRPDGGHRFARGVWDGDELPATELGGGVITPSVTLSLEPMELGLCENTPFVDQPSWAERMIRLREMLGPFHLAYLEAILRAADMRASAAAEREAARRQWDAAQSVSLSERIGKEVGRA
jgi:CRISPR-associated endonuclease/helicase Cas3